MGHQASGGEEEPAEGTAEIYILRSGGTAVSMGVRQAPWVGQISLLGCSLTCTEDASVPGWAGRG